MKSRPPRTSGLSRSREAASHWGAHGASAVTHYFAAVGATPTRPLNPTPPHPEPRLRDKELLLEERARSAEAEMQALRQQAEMATELRERAEKAEQEQKAMEKQKAKVEEELREHMSEEAFWQRYLAFKHYLDTLREHAGKTAKNKWPLKIRREHLVADVLDHLLVQMGTLHWMKGSYVLILSC